MLKFYFHSFKGDKWKIHGVKSTWRFFFEKIACPSFSSSLQKGYLNSRKKCWEHVFEKCDSNINFPTSKNNKRYNFSYKNKISICMS